jgi:hypothetical protein
MRAPVVLLLVLTASSALAQLPAAPSFDKPTSYRFVYYAYAAYNMPAVNT